MVLMQTRFLDSFVLKYKEVVVFCIVYIRWHVIIIFIDFLKNIFEKFQRNQKKSKIIFEQISIKFEYRNQFFKSKNKIKKRQILNKIS